jgi:hypothetical protein
VLVPTGFPELIEGVDGEVTPSCSSSDRQTMTMAASRASNPRTNMLRTNADIMKMSRGDLSFSSMPTAWYEFKPQAVE